MAAPRFTSDSRGLVPRAPRKDPAARAVGQRVRELREAAGLKQDALSRKAKISPQFLSLLENGHANPSIGVVARLSSALGLPLSAFFSSEAPEALNDDLSAITALVGAQPPAARKQALRFLRAFFEG